jgi:hypothetical protein
MPNTQLIEFKLEDDTVLTVEGIREDGDRNMVARPGGAERAEKSFADALITAKKAADLVLTSFKEMNSPDEIDLEFGIKFSAKAGVIIASADSEASFKVNLKWKKP